MLVFGCADDEEAFEAARTTPAGFRFTDDGGVTVALDRTPTRIVAWRPTAASLAALA